MTYRFAHSAHKNLLKNLKDKIKDAIEVEHKGRRLVVNEIHMPDFKESGDLEREKAAKVNGVDFSDPIKATISLKEGNKTIDRSRVKLLDVPSVTKRGTYIVGGNEYSFPLQKRILPGVYTEEKDDGTVQSWINSAKGVNLKIILRDKGDFVMKVYTTQVNLLAFLEGMGVSRAAIKRSWGQEVFQRNLQARGANDPKKALKKFYDKVKYKNDDPVQKDNVPGYRKWINDYFNDKSELDEDNVEVNIGEKHSRINPKLLLQASRNILDVTRGDKKEHNRESLIHNQFMDISDFIIERLNQGQYKYKIARTLKRNMSKYDKVSKIYRKNLLQKPVESTFTQTSLGKMPKQTNPMDIASSFNEVTIMGEGGIGDVHAVKHKTRSLDPSHLGFLDLAHTPEGINIGTTMHLANNVRKKGKDIVNDFINVKTGKKEQLRPIDVHKAYVSFPEFYKDGKVVPGEDGTVRSVYRGEIKNVKPKKIQYILPRTTDMFDMNVMGIPFLGHNNGVRVITGSKMATQAKPLKYREPPLVQCAVDEESDRTVEEVMGESFSSESPVKGVVDEVSENKIVIKDDKGKKHDVKIAKNFWLNDNNYIDAEPIVEEGDKIKKGQRLTETNYTKDGELALGKNLKTGYVAYKGYNHEDATVISESAAEKLTSLHAYQKTCPVNTDEIIDKAKYKSYFPTVFDSKQLNKVGKNGIIKKGQEVEEGDPLVLKLKEVQEDAISKKLENISRLLKSDYRDISMVWDKNKKGKVEEVHQRKDDILVVIKTEEKARVGDKMVGRYGNKATISTILPDSEMPKDEDGSTLDILLNPDTVPGRMNLGQLLETTASRVAKKDGKKYISKPFSGNSSKKIEKELEERGLKDHSTITDDEGNEIDGVLTGDQYFFKLEHQVDKKMSARGAGAGYSYTLDGIPARGDEGSGRSIGLAEMYALLSHGADTNIKEMFTFKGDKQLEMWRAVENGTFIPKPEIPRSSQKFVEMLRGMGVNLEEKSGSVNMVPFLDKDIEKYSNGEIKDATALRAKDLKEEDGGLFDLDTTGGIIGDKWSHIELSEEMPHPTFKKSIVAVTRIRNKDFDAIMKGDKGVIDGDIVDADKPGAKKGGKAIKDLLSRIDIGKRLEKAKEEAKGKKGTPLNKLHREIRILRNFKDNDLDLEDMVVSKVPVIPPQFRQIVELPNGSLSVGDVNEHYRSIILMNNQLEKFKGNPAFEDEKKKMRQKVYEGFEGTMGFSPGLVDKKDVKGLAKTIAGSEPKSGYYHSKLFKRRQEISGTAVVGPEPKLDMDQIGIPEEMAWEIFKPFTVKELKSMGLTSMKARDAIDDKTDMAKSALKNVMEDRMVIANRAPTLHKFSIMAYKPQLVAGHSVKMPVEALAGHNADFDGDTFGIHVPVSKEANEEAKDMVPSKNMFVPGSGREYASPQLQKDYLLGIYKLSREGKKTNKEFGSIKKAITEAKEKNIKWTDQIKIKGIGKTTAGRAVLNTYIPKDLRVYDKPFEKDLFTSKLKEVYKKHGRKDFKEMMGGFKKEGRKYVYTSGTSFLLSDLRTLDKTKDRVYSKADKNVKKIKKNKRLTDKEKRRKIIEEYAKAGEEITERVKNLPDNSAGKINNISSMAESGMSKPGPNQMKELIGSIGLLKDHRENIMEDPVRGNYTEGLTSADFYTHMFQRRKSLIDKSRSVSGPGMLSKELTNTAAGYKITEVDCGTSNGRDKKIDKNILDRVILENVGTVNRGSIIDNDALEKLKKSGRQKVNVRTVLTCETSDGICSKCFGYDETGGFPNVGKNIGVSEIQAITERSVQLPMKSHHVSGSVTETSNMDNAFDRALDIFRMPNNLKNKAVLSKVDGMVQDIRDSGYGGKVVTINGVDHNVPQKRELKVSNGDSVDKGDAITDGSIKPQELLETKGVEAVQEQMTADLKDTFAQAGVHAEEKTFEMPVKVYTEKVRITDPGDNDDFVPGDYSTLSKVKGWNRSNPGKREIKYRNVLPGSMTQPHKGDDWAQRMALGRIKRTLQEGPGMGFSSTRKPGQAPPFADIALGPGTSIKEPGYTRQ